MVDTATNVTPDVAVAEANPPVAKTIESELLCKPNISYEMNGNRISVLLLVRLLVCQIYDSSQICSSYYMVQLNNYLIYNTINYSS